MRKLTIGAILMAMAVVFSTNVMAEEVGQCEFLKDGNYHRALYGLCNAFCDAPGHSGLEDIVDLTEEQIKEIDPAGLVLFDLFEKKAGVDGPKLPCVSYAACPVWTQEELDRIGTLGGTILIDYEHAYGSYESYYDREFGSGFHHFAQVIKNGDSYTGRYLLHNTGYPSDYRAMELTAEEYASCKQALIDHVTKP